MSIFRAFLMLGLLVGSAAALTAQDRQPDPKGNKDLGPKAVDIVAQVARDMQSAEERLKRTDPGDATRKIQRDIIDGLNALINQNDKASGGGGGGGQKTVKKKVEANKQQKNDSGGGIPQNPDQAADQKLGPKAGQNQDDQDQIGKAKGSQDEGPQGIDKDKGKGYPEGKNDPEGAAKNAGKESDKDGKQGQAKTNDKDDGKDGGLAAVKNDGSRNARTDLTADLYRADWGHLPLAKRLEMDAYSKERFMPRYDEVTQQYYRTIAEQGVGKK